MRSTDFDPACFRDHTINALGLYRQCHIGNKERGAMMDQDDVNEYLMAIMGVEKRDLATRQNNFPTSKCCMKSRKLYCWRHETLLYTALHNRDLKTTACYLYQLSILLAIDYIGIIPFG